MWLKSTPQHTNVNTCSFLSNWVGSSYWKFQSRNTFTFMYSGDLSMAINFIVVVPFIKLKDMAYELSSSGSCHDNDIISILILLFTLFQNCKASLFHWHFTGLLVPRLSSKVFKCVYICINTIVSVTNVVNLHVDILVSFY